MSKPTDCAFLEPVFMMLPMRRMSSSSLANFLLFRTSSHAAVAATMSGLQSLIEKILIGDKDQSKPPRIEWKVKISNNSFGQRF